MNPIIIKDLFCELCSMQFDKKVVYDIHMSFVHKKTEEIYNNDQTMIKIENEDLTQEVAFESTQNSQKFNSSNERTEKSSMKHSFCDDKIPPHIPSKKNKLSEHIVVVQKIKKSYNCSVCNHSFSLKCKLKRHFEAVHEGKKPHKCSICEYSCKTKAQLKNHINAVHEGKKPYKCSICEYSCTIKGTLKMHFEAVHEGKKQHKCSICDYSCAAKSDLQKHINAVHERKKPHKCPICEYSFARKNHLKRHVNAVHNRLKPQICSICDCSFARKDILKKHIISVHEGKIQTTLTKSELLRSEVKTEIKTEIKTEVKEEPFEKFEAREQGGIDFITSKDFDHSFNKSEFPTQETDFAIKNNIREETNESNVPLKKFKQDCNQ